MLSALGPGQGGGYGGAGPAFYSNGGMQYRERAVDMGGVDPSYKVKVMVTLRRTYGGNDDYKKMMLVMDGANKIHALKRTIEREFLDLFPNEPPYVVAKLED